MNVETMDVIKYSNESSTVHRTYVKPIDSFNDLKSLGENTYIVIKSSKASGAIYKIKKIYDEHIILNNERKAVFAFKFDFDSNGNEFYAVIKDVQNTIMGDDVNE
jgi:hypothetical protein